MFWFAQPTAARVHKASFLVANLSDFLDGLWELSDLGMAVWLSDYNKSGKGWRVEVWSPNELDALYAKLALG